MVEAVLTGAITSIHITQHKLIQMLVIDFVADTEKEHLERKTKRTWFYTRKCSKQKNNIE